MCTTDSSEWRACVSCSAIANGVVIQYDHNNYCCGTNPIQCMPNATYSLPRLPQTYTPIVSNPSPQPNLYTIRACRYLLCRYEVPGYLLLQSMILPLYHTSILCTTALSRYAQFAVLLYICATNNTCNVLATVLLYIAYHTAVHYIPG